MGTALKSAQEVTAALEAQDWGRVRQLVAAGFVFLNPYAFMPEMSVQDWLSISRMFANAFSDFTYNFAFGEEKGPQVWITLAFEGTNDRDLDLTILDRGIIPPTGKHGRAERSISIGTVNDNGKLASIEVIDQPEGAGLLGLLAKVGINLG